MKCGILQRAPFLPTLMFSHSSVPARLSILLLAYLTTQCQLPQWPSASITRVRAIRQIRRNSVLRHNSFHPLACLSSRRTPALILEGVSQEVDTKANAVSKLCYLQMFGYDISWAAFNIVEGECAPVAHVYSPPMPSYSRSPETISVVVCPRNEPLPSH